MASRLLLSVLDVIVAYFAAGGLYLGLLRLRFAEWDADAVALPVYFAIFFLIYYGLIKVKPKHVP